MPKEEGIPMDGVVMKALANTQFIVQLDGGHEVMAHVAGRMRKNFIRIVPGDKVTVEISPYDPKRGRITFRHKSAQPTTAATGQRRAMWRKRG